MLSRKATITLFRCVRTSPGLVNKLLPYRSLHSSSKILSSLIDKDLPIPSEPTPVGKLYPADTDILLEQLKKARSSSRVLELVSMHLDVMNNNHIVTCFNVIYDVVKTGQAGLIECHNIRDNEVFQSLCSQTMHRLRSFEPSDVITVLKVLTKLNVHCNTYVMQALFKILCSQINELDLNQLTFLNFLLNKQLHNPLVDSLKLALPLVLQVQVNQQLDSDNLQQVVECLSMACRAKLKVATVEKILACLQSRIHEITAPQASTIIFSLFFLNVPAENYMAMLKSSFEILSNNIDQVQRSNLLSLSRMCVKQSFYYRTFFMRLCERAVLEHWNLNECYELIRRLHKLNFVSPELLDLFTVNIYNNPSAVRSDQQLCILNISECLSFVDYQPKKLSNALSVLTSAEDKLTKLYDSHPHLYLKIIVCWAMLGHFPTHWSSKVFDEKYLYNSWSLSKKLSRTMEFELYLCCLSWALEVYNKSNKFNMPVSYMERIYRAVHEREKKSRQYPLSKFLEIGLGGPQFFQTGVFSRNGHVIDHVLCMRSGNYPVALCAQNSNDSHIKEQTTFIEDIHVLDNSKMIAVLVAGPNDYSTDPEILKGHMALKVKSLIKMSLIPVVIKYETWYKLPDREKIPYLMREIKLAHESENQFSEIVAPAEN